MKGEWITRSAKDRGAVKSELEIGRRLKTDQLSVNKWLRIEELTVLPDDAGWVQYKLMARQLAEEEFRPHRPQPVEKARQFQRRYPINVKHLDRRRIVAEVQRSTVTGFPREALLAKSDLPIVQIQADIGIKKLKLMNGRGGSGWWWPRERVTPCFDQSR